MSRKIFRLIVYALAGILLTPVIVLNIEKLAELKGWDSVLVNNWGAIVSSLSQFAQNPWYLYFFGVISGGAVFMWADHFIRGKSSEYVSADLAEEDTPYDGGELNLSAQPEPTFEDDFEWYASKQGGTLPARITIIELLREAQAMGWEWNDKDFGISKFTNILQDAGSIGDIQFFSREKERYDLKSSNNALGEIDQKYWLQHKMDWTTCLKISEYTGANKHRISRKLSVQNPT